MLPGVTSSGFLPLSFLCGREVGAGQPQSGTEDTQQGSW